MTKPLPKRLSKELFLTLNYANCRFMKSKEAFRTEYNQKCIFTAKVVEGDDENRKIKLLHVHLRTPARDRWNNKDDELDIDLYFHEKDFNNLKEILNTKMEI